MNSLQYGLTPKMKPISPRRPAIVAALDVGTSKIACIIARLEPHHGEVLRRRTHSVHVLGSAHVESVGMKGGAAANLSALEETIRRAVDAAERSASVQLESVAVSISGGRLGSEHLNASVDVAGPSVSEDDIANLMAAGSHHSVRDGRVVLHSLPIGYAVDGARGVREPRGMLARNVGIDLHTVTADVAPPRNLMLAVERCHLSVEAMVASPYASGLSVLADDEADLGAAVVDMGAGTTTIAIFGGGNFHHADGFALGGHHVTMDVARGLGCRVSDAERIKAIYGTVLPGGTDERDMISVPAVSDDPRDPPQTVSRSTLAAIVRPRVEEILEMVRDRLAASPFSADPRGTVVLTGGACQLTGMSELAAHMLNRTVRIGRPLGVSGLPDTGRGPAFSVATGLLVYPQVAHLEHFEPRRTRQLKTGTGGYGYIARVGRWLRESF